MDARLSQHEKRMRRLLYRATHRGMKEMDILLGDYAKANLEKMEPSELDAFEMLLTIQDQKFYAILSGDAPVPSEFDGPLMKALIHHARHRLKP